MRPFKNVVYFSFILLACLLAFGCDSKQPTAPQDGRDSVLVDRTGPSAADTAPKADPWDLPEAYQKAARNAERSQRGLDAANRFLTFWLDQIDPDSGLLPQYLQPLPYVKDPKNPEEFPRIWTTMNVASDLYPFVAIAAYLTDATAYAGPVRAIFKREQELTTTPNGLPTHYLLDEKRQWDLPTHELIFGTSEYVKDGLVPLIELTGETLWLDRAKRLTDAILSNSEVVTPYGTIPSTQSEVNGEMMQSLSRLYYLTGDARYLKAGQAIGDAYFKIVMPANNGLPCHAWNFGKGEPYDGRLTLRDHGNEVVLGLAMAYAMMRDQKPEIADAWRPALETMLKRIAAEGRAANGFFVSGIDAKTGAVLDDHLSDNWGYLLAAYQILYDLHGDKTFLEPVTTILGNLRQVDDYNWEEGADGLADALESAVYFQRREPSPALRAWIEAQFKKLGAHQADNGYIDGTYLDGNFARTMLLVALMESAGVRAVPWSRALRVGGFVDGDALYLSVHAETDYAGKLLFDSERWRTTMHLPSNIARINEWPTWWAADADRRYRVEIRDANGKVKTDAEFSGSDLLSGVRLSVGKGDDRFVKVTPLDR